MSDNIFSDDNNTDQGEVDGAQALAELVGEGKKYASIEELAKAKMFADKHIKNLETEQEELRKDLSTRLSVDEALERVRQQQQQPPKTNAANTASNPAPVEPKNALSNDEQLVARMRELMAEEKTREVQESNFSQAIDALVSVYGDDKTARAAIQSRAKELGVGVNFLRDAASTSPRAFKELMGLDGGASTSNNNALKGSRSDVNPDAIVNQQKRAPKAGTYAFYENLRKTDPKLYWQPKTQRQMHADAQRNADFYAAS